MTAGAIRGRPPLGGWVAGVPLGALLLLLPAVWNGFPLVYYDSVDYIPLPFGAEMPVFRTAAYGLFTGVGRLGGTLWAVVVVQSLLVATALWLAAAAFGAPGRTGRTFALLLAAATLGGLPWYVSQIMADGFAGVTILGLLALLLAGDRLAPPGRLLLAAITALATALHTSHIGLGIGLLALGLLAASARRVWPMLPAVRPGPAAATVALALTLAICANVAATGRAFLTQPATVQTLGLFVEAGLAKRYLDRHCPGRAPAPFRLCAHRDSLPRTANAFLWAGGLFEALGGFAGMEGEARAIVGGVVREMPLALAWEATRLTARQFVMIGLGDGIIPLQFMLRQPIAAHYPDDVAAYDAARQQRGIDFTPVHPFELPLYAGALLALLALGTAAWRAGDRRGALLAAGVLLGLLGNAFICGALSNPNHRYQGRITWLPLAAVCLLAYRPRDPISLGTPHPARP